MTERPTKVQLRILRALIAGAKLETWGGRGRLWTAHEATAIKLSTVEALRKRYWIRLMTTRAKCRGHVGPWKITRIGRDAVANSTHRTAR